MYDTFVKQLKIHHSLM